MNATHCLGYPREFFNEAITRRRYPSQEPTAVLQATYARDDGTSWNGVTSIKFHLPQFERAIKYLRLAAWFPQPFWLHIRRDDVLAQAISQEIAIQTKAFMSKQPEQREPVYSSAAISTRIAALRAGEAEWWRFYRACSLTPFVLAYDEIAADPAKAARAVAQYIDEPLIDVPDEHRRSNYFEGISKQRNNRNAEWTRRFIAEHGAP